MTALNAQDLDAVMDLWADDAVLVPAEGPPVVGREAIRDLLSGLTSTGTRLQIETSTTYVAGEAAVRVGSLKLVGSGGGDAPVELSSSYVTVYRRGSDAWRIAIDAPAGFTAARGGNLGRGGIRW